jgi:hypothetical protein
MLIKIYGSGSDISAADRSILQGLAVYGFSYAFSSLVGLKKAWDYIS